MNTVFGNLLTLDVKSPVRTSKFGIFGIRMSFFKQIEYRKQYPEALLSNYYQRRSR